MSATAIKNKDGKFGVGAEVQDSVDEAEFGALGSPTSFSSKVVVIKCIPGVIRIRVYLTL